MATIKDIAREAGVSQGTVSNVLNGKGNVSSIKIRQVQQAAEKLGYSMNQRAQILRRGSSNTLAAVLPNLYNRSYVDFYTSFRNFANSRGYEVSLHLTDDLPVKEQHAIEEILSAMTDSAAIFTCRTDDICEGSGLKNICYVERAPEGSTPHLSFDFYRLGCEMAERAMRDGCRFPAVLCENTAFASQTAFLHGLQDALARAHLPLAIHPTDTKFCTEDVFETLASTPAPDCVFVSNYTVAQTACSITRHFLVRQNVRVYAAAPVFTFPSMQCTEFELNYRLLGRRAAERLINGLKNPDAPQPAELLPPSGVRAWMPRVEKNRCKRLTIITPDGHNSAIFRHISQMYTKETGIEINVAAYTYNGLNEVLNNIENTTSLDIVRLDSKRWSSHAQRIFVPLKEVDPDIDEVFDAFLPDISRESFSHCNGTLYALPSTPCAQLLFYRRDLFENPIFRRRYQEMYGCELLPPETYAEFNRIARFFTRSFNPDSPVPYGTGLMLSNATFSAKEYLSRYFSHSTSLYDEDGRILLDSPISRQSMEELIALRDCVDLPHSSVAQYALSSFAEGNTAMALDYSNFTGNITSARSHVSDRIGYAMVPGGNPMLGGSSIGICRYSQQQKEAAQFLRWLCSPEVTTAMALMGTASPCSKTYENYEVVEQFPWLLLTRKCFAMSHTTYIPPHCAANFNEPKFLSILGMAVSTALGGVMPVDDTLKFAQLTFEKTFPGK